MSALDREYAIRGLVRPKRAERQLHATAKLLDGSLTAVRFQWKGVTVRGFRKDDLVSLHDKIWPRCPWIARGLCEISELRKGTKCP